jgi:Domain of unknown function (DUF4291)
MLLTELYKDQVDYWPKSGRHILAQADDESIVVYQAYRPSIGQFTIEHGYFGGEFSYTRMSWIKTNFLWMMYRSGWGVKVGQEITLAIRLRRSFFDSLLLQAVESSFTGSQYSNYDEWNKAITRSSVRIQWDPDHHPRGAPLERRALQLGLRGKLLKDYGRQEILEIIDMTEFVEEQRANTTAANIAELIVPVERVYIPGNADIRAKLRID